MSSSCCNGNCGCGAGCKCGSSCTGCKMYPDMEESSSIASQTTVLGVAAEKSYGEMGVGGESGGCKCGSDCKCDPCNCR